jgi:alcohol dehydrogenase class IV
MTAHAAALSGCALGAAPLGLTHRLAAAVGQTGKTTASQAAGIILSYAIEYRAVNGLLDGEALLELLGGQDRHARTPKGQRGPAAIYFLRNLLNLLYERTDGRIKRTLRDLGLTSEDLRDAGEHAHAAGKGGAPVAAAILDRALEGRPFLELN